MQHEKKSKKLLDRIPHPLALLFFIVVGAAILTYIIPAGSYERETVDDTTQTVPGSFEYTESNPVGIMELFTAIPEGFQEMSDIVFVTFAAAMMFGLLERTGMLENTVGTFVRKVGVERRFLIVVIMTFVYGFFGIFIGLENNIALVPIAVLLSVAIGGDAMLGAGIAIGGVLVGFGLSPFNPYTVGVGHRIAEMELFSGWIFRSILVVTTLSVLSYFNVRYFKKILKDRDKSLGYDIDTSDMKLSKSIDSYHMRKRDIAMLLVFISGIIVMLVGIFTQGWYINEVAAIYLMIGIACGIIAKMNASQIAQVFSKALEPSALAAILIGVAMATQVVLNHGNISDTVAHGLTSLLEHLPTTLAAVFMAISQSIINILIPSGSGQAVVTLPIMIPVGDMLDITRQTTILAFQIGDGLTNLFSPTLAGLMAMLGLCRVPYGRWIRYIFPFVIIAICISFVALVISVLINWG
ncbi:YfcC family protein [Virgibacillus sp. NKC19-16]|uniref:YfcC family protein n=1 Tax=Virgibacillus salidurans TaxID=2831673 RepID=UPI001F354B8A|nr:AbgT family transporter [Virgibacillus sp. NKC19-16]UJL45180.1 YfcC family protein [Virgibacillus sp. NKC19-16]